MLFVKVVIIVLLAEVHGRPIVPYDSDESLELPGNRLTEGRSIAAPKKCSYMCNIQRKAVFTNNPHSNPGFFGRMLETFQEDVKQVGNVLGNAAMETKSYIEDAVTKDERKLETFYQGAIGKTEAVLAHVKPVIEDVENFVGSVAHHANAEVGVIANAASSIVEKVSADVSSIANTVVNSTVAFENSIIGTVQNIDDFVTSSAHDVSSVVKEAATEIKDGATAVANKTWEIASSIKNSVEKEADDIEEAIDNVEMQSENWFKGAWQSVTNFMDDIGVTFKELFHMISMSSLVIIGLTVVVLLVKAVYHVKRFFHITEQDLLASKTGPATVCDK